VTETTSHPRPLSGWIALLLTLFLVTGCQGPAGTKGPLPGLTTRTIQLDDETRRYAIYLPERLEDPAPLVFELHGGGIYIEDETGESGHKTPYKLWMEIAEREGLIVVYPEGLDGRYGKPTWNDCRANASVNSDADDVGFISTLIHELAARYPVDESRIYVSGTSNGGLMALRLATELSTEIAAVAAVAAAMPDQSKCIPPVDPIPVLFMNGTADNHLPYGGGTLSNPPNPDHGSVYSTERSVAIWTALDQADTTPAVQRFPDIDLHDGSTVTRFRYSNGIGGTEVVLYRIDGGGHSAPSIRERYSRLFERYFGKQNHDIEMTSEVWTFFKDKRRE